MPLSLVRVSQEVARELKHHRMRLVLAESCTAGLIAASLARVPGVSDYFCGSAVTYRDATKHQWLEVSEQDLEAAGAVSETVARQMARGAMRMTPESELAAAVTGHLGPDAPEGQDGLVFIAIGRRWSAVHGEEPILVQRIQLETTTRVARQREAAVQTLRRLLDELQLPVED